MESRCCLMHRLKKAVRASLVLLSLLFYVFGLHVHYVNRTVTAIGALKDSEPEVQQQALHYIMSGETNTRDGERFNEERISQRLETIPAAGSVCYRLYCNLHHNYFHHDQDDQKILSEKIVYVGRRT